MIHGRQLAAHYKKHPPYKNPFKPTKDEINKVYAINEKGKASFLKNAISVRYTQSKPI